MGVWAPYTEVVETPMKEKVALEDVSLVAVWTWWWLRSRKPGSPIEIPPMPPLEEWPKELLARIKRHTGVDLVKK